MIGDRPGPPIERHASEISALSFSRMNLDLDTGAALAADSHFISATRSTLLHLKDG